MSVVLKNGKVYANGEFRANDGIVLNDGIFDGERVITLDNSFILPSLCDVHVHFREPGQSYKETIATGSLAAAHGGYTAVGTMPNLDPPPHDLETLGIQLDLIERGSDINVIPYGSITYGQKGAGKLSDMEAMADKVIAFSDDGVGVQDNGLMRAGMELAKSLGKLIVAHCEDNELVKQGRIRESEWRQIERDLKLADEVGAGYHVCHISCRESAEVIREAKKSGVDVTCETAPHYLVLDTDSVSAGVAADPDRGGRFKMNPPIKDKADREALVEALNDGTIDMIATDHAPHSAEEKSRGFEKSLNGIVGLECAFPVIYTELVLKGIISFKRMIELMSTAPRERFGIVEPDSYAVFDLENEYVIDPDTFLSKGRCTPFEGYRVKGRNLLTVCGGRIVYEDKERIK
jgi:dihydroorotase